jgi:hypothetical protein
MVANEQRVGYALKNLELQVLDNHFLQRRWAFFD